MPHPFSIVCDQKSRILILGTTPSPKSLQQGFYYGHPQNRFWPLLAGLLNTPIPENIAQKKALIINHHMALWDVLSDCDIVGASDASIRNAIPNNIEALVHSCPIAAVFLNGTKAYEIYLKFFKGKIALPAYRLPSTSPANAAFTMEKLQEQWKIILRYLTDVS